MDIFLHAAIGLVHFSELVFRANAHQTFGSDDVAKALLGMLYVGLAIVHGRRPARQKFDRGH